MHEASFLEIVQLLFHYCLNNTVNQLAMRRHIPYLVHMAAECSLVTGPLLGQLVSAERLNSFGQKFTQYIVRRITEENLQQPQMYKLLTFLVQNTQPLKILVSSQLLRSPVFRHKLYLNPTNVSRKIERIKELARKILVL